MHQLTTVKYSYIWNPSQSLHIPPVIKFNSSTANTDCSKANLLDQYFYSVFHISFSPASPVSPPITCESLDSITVSITDVYEALTSLDVNKSCGIDGIAPRVLHCCAGVLCMPLHHLFSMSLCHATLPSNWKIHKVIYTCFQNWRSSISYKLSSYFTPIQHI